MAGISIISRPIATRQTQTPIRPSAQDQALSTDNVPSPLLPTLLDLPSHVIADILSRLPAKNVIHCRCVCRTFRKLLSEPYFIKLHLSRSPTTLIIAQYDSAELKKLKLVELEDEPDHHDLYYDPVMEFSPGVGFQLLVGSVNGLVCLCSFSQHESDTIYICNPTLRQYATLPKPKHERKYPFLIDTAFGFSSVSGEYKVVRMSEGPADDRRLSTYRTACEVYTLGTGSWRSVGDVPLLEGWYGAASLNDKLHWLVSELEGQERVICSFDVEKEVFRTLSPAPPLNPISSSGYQIVSLTVLQGCLCVCDNSADDGDIVVCWMMEDYGVKESCSKEIVISKKFVQDWLSYEMIYPLKVLKDGDVLILFWDVRLFSYSPKSQTLEDLACAPGGIMLVVLHDPSFVSLRDVRASILFEKV
ncbi:hypothetical protein RJ639_022804 [Escallonia herrerae]|uniref:F-box domain-containing protein n=1 Tax=Escallonia herrerae TaxID=1293975 RepID=A0AA88V252_9ASTE|nr:hypothetical protein RJ639_022804 [Escallonia herrerae]